MKNSTSATMASANRIGCTMAPPAIAMMSRITPRINSMMLSSVRAMGYEQGVPGAGALTPTRPRPMRTCVRMTAQGWPLTRLRRALDHRNPLGALGTGRADSGSQALLAVLDDHGLEREA